MNKRVRVRSLRNTNKRYGPNKTNVNKLQKSINKTQKNRNRFGLCGEQKKLRRVEDEEENIAEKQMQKEEDIKTCAHLQNITFRRKSSKHSVRCCSMFHVFLPSIHSRKRVAIQSVSKCTRSGIWYVCSCALAALLFLAHSPILSC